MGAKNKHTYKTCACGRWEWKSQAGQYCKYCGAAWGGAQSGGTKGGGKPDTTTQGQRTPPAPGFKFAPPTLIEGLSEQGKRLLKVMECEPNRADVLAMGVQVPGLMSAAEAICEIRWPTTSPRRTLERDHQTALTAARAAERASLDAQTVVTRAREAYDAAVKAEEDAAAKWKEAQAKVDGIIADLAALGRPDDKDDKADDFKEADDGMSIHHGTAHLEGMIAEAAKMLTGMQAHHAKLKAKADEAAAAEALGLQKGKGKGSGDSVRSPGPYGADEEEQASKKRAADEAAAAAVAKAEEACTRAKAVLEAITAAAAEANKGVAEFRALRSDFDL